MIVQDATRPRPLGLTQDQLDEAWLRTTGSSDRHRAYAAELEAMLAEQGTDRATAVALSVWTRSALIRDWAVRALPAFARGVREVQRAGGDVDDQVHAIAEYLATWGPEGLE